MAVPTKTTSYNGQTVYKYTDTWVWVLSNRLYFKAGKTHWPVAWDKGILETRGIGMNKALYKAVLQTSNDFIIYDAHNDEFYKLDDKRLITSYRGRETQNGKTLIVTPFDAYKTVPASQVPDVDGIKRRA